MAWIRSAQLDGNAAAGLGVRLVSMGFVLIAIGMVRLLLLFVSIR